MFKRVVNGSIAALYTLILGAVTLLPVQSVQAAVDTCTWTGAVSTDTADAANWTGCDNGNVPEAGDSLVFDGTATRMNPIVNIDLEFATVTVSGNAYNFQNGTGNLRARTLVVSGTGTTFNGPVVLHNTFGGPTLTITDGATDTVFGPVELDSAANQVTFSLSEDVNFNGIISGTTTTLVIDGTHAATFNGANTFTTSVSIIFGSLGATKPLHLCSTSTCFGNSANLVQHSSNTFWARIGFTGGGAITVPNPFLLRNSDAINGVILANDDTTVTLTGNLDLSATSTFHTNTLTNATLNINDPALDTTGLAITSLGVGATEGANLYIGSTLTGNGTISVNGTSLQLTGDASAYDGNINLTNDSFAYVTSTDGLGSATGSTTVGSGSSIVFDGNAGLMSFTESISIAGAGTGSRIGALNNSGDAISLGAVALTGNATIAQDDDANGAFSITGVISGTGNLTIVGDETDGFAVVFGGGTANTYSGSLTVDGEQLNAAKSNAITGDITIINSGVLVQTSGTTNAVADTASVNLNGSSTQYSLFDGVDTIGKLTGNGQLSLGANLTLSSNDNYTFNGTISGSGSIVKNGNGTATFSGNATDVDFVINGGTLTFTGTASNSDVTANTGSTFKGTGTVRNLSSVGASINPGTSPGIMNVTSLTLDSASVFQVEIDGPTAGTQYDRLVASGAVNLGNATLTVAPTYTPAAGTVFTVVQAGSVTGTFNGLGDGATITSNGVTFRVNYTGTTVTLTYVSGSVPGSTLAETGFSTLAILTLSMLLVSGSIMAVRRSQYTS